MTENTRSSRADVITEAPARYAKQLVAHLGRKLEFTTHGPTSTTTIGATTAQITIGDGILTLLATSSDEQGLTTAEDVLGGHLERFGQRNELVVTWIRTPERSKESA